MAIKRGCLCYWVILVSCLVKVSKSEDELFRLPTVTVRGFLNFQTTVDGTVIVFTPATEPKPTKTALLQKADLNSQEGIHREIQNSLNPIKTHDLKQFEKDPFLPHISDNAVLPSVNNDLEKIASSANQYPTGLVTVLGGTHVDGRSTTVFQTKVIGTYIEGKYAQILQSTSHIVATTPSRDSSESTELEENSVEHSSSAPDVSVFQTKVIGPYSEGKYAQILPSTSRIDATIALGDSSATTEVEENSVEHSSSAPNMSEGLRSSFVVPLRPESDRPTESLESVHFVPTTFNPVTSIVARLPDNSSSMRNSTSRIRFLSPRRPSQSVRLNRFKVKLTLRSADDYNVTREELEEENSGEEEIEVIGVDPAKVVFQETTITSEVTLHVGRRKSVRTLTITTSVPLTVNPSDIQGILSSDLATDHHIVSRTFTTTERALQTSVVPVYDGKSTVFHTVTESFFIMKIITAYRTLPSDGALVLESLLEETTDPTLEVAANIPSSVIESTEQPTPASNALLSLGQALSNNPLAAVYLGLQQLNAHITLYSTITDTSFYVTTETFYNTRTIRFYDGRSTRVRMISDPISTKKKTITTTLTSVHPYLNTHALQQQQQLLIAATQPPQFSTVTATYTTVTTTTSLSTRIYTLIYNGFSTKFRTVTSTTLQPATVTVTSTSKVPLAPNLSLAYPYST